MKDDPNITKGRGRRLLNGMGMVIAGFVSMVAGLCLGSYIADRREERTVVHGVRREMVLRLAHMGPQPFRRAAMAAMADGVITVREERHLYMIADQISLQAAKARRMQEDDASPSRRRDLHII
jgi:hypothetical protein